MTFTRIYKKIKAYNIFVKIRICRKTVWSTSPGKRFGHRYYNHVFAGVK